MTVQPGQIWADNDKRAAGRQIRVDGVAGRYALCAVVRDRDNPQPLIGRYNVRRPEGWTAVGHTTSIRLDRFKPTSTGYRRISP